MSLQLFLLHFRQFFFSFKYRGAIVLSFLWTKGWMHQCMVANAVGFSTHVLLQNLLTYGEVDNLPELQFLILDLYKMRHV